MGGWVMGELAGEVGQEKGDYRVSLTAPSPWTRRFGKDSKKSKGHASKSKEGANKQA